MYEPILKTRAELHYPVDSARVVACEDKRDGLRGVRAETPLFADCSQPLGDS